MEPVHKARWAVTEIGSERAPLVVIDDAVPAPDRLVAFAAQCCTFRPVANNLYPGLRAAAPADYVQAVIDAVLPLASDVFGLHTLYGSECDFSLVTTRPEELQLLQALPHFDTTDSGQLAVLHYLCPAACGGTSFYRHRSTGYESVCKERYDTYVSALGADLKASGPPERAYIGGDTPLFQRIGSVEAAFNRLVIYRSFALHSGDIGRDFPFFSDPRKGRLTLNTFLHFRAI